MRGWNAEMRPASFLLHAPAGEDHHFTRRGPAWTVDLDELAPVLATLREANRWLRRIWRFDPATGHHFGIGSDLRTRRVAGRIELHAARWSAWAPQTGHLQLAHTDLHILRQRLLQQQQALRRAEHRKARHGIAAH